MAYHAQRSPSKAHRWMRCPGSIVQERAHPETGRSKYADEGTVAHHIAAELLLGAEVNTHPGERWWIVRSDVTGEEMIRHDLRAQALLDSGNATALFEITLDADFTDAVYTYVDWVRGEVEALSLVAESVELLVEQAVPIGHLTGEKGATGTADAVIVYIQNGVTHLHVIDLKFGKGKKVSANDNEQMQIYALGVEEQISLTYTLTDESTVTMSIMQPRQDTEPRTITATYAEMQAFAEQVRQAAYEVDMAEATHAITGKVQADYIRPDPQACGWCRAKVECLAEPVKRMVETVDITELSPIDPIADYYAFAEVAETWIKGVRALVAEKLAKGEAVEGLKMVAGCEGHRAWKDEEAAKEAIIKAGYKPTVEEMRSPTDLEKEVKKKPLFKTLFDHLITRSPGKPKVVHASDPRPAIQLNTDELSTIEDDEE